MSHEFEPASARIIEPAISVHEAFGPGFLESILNSNASMLLVK